MYMLYWHTTDGRKYATSDAKGVVALANVFENQNVQFAVSHELGRCNQESFGCNGYKYWLGLDDLFLG